MKFLLLTMLFYPITVLAKPPCKAIHHCDITEDGKKIQFAIMKKFKPKPVKKVKVKLQRLSLDLIDTPFWIGYQTRGYKADTACWIYNYKIFGHFRNKSFYVKYNKGRTITPMKLDQQRNLANSLFALFKRLDKQKRAFTVKQYGKFIRTLTQLIDLELQEYEV